MEENKQKLGYPTRMRGALFAFCAAAILGCGAESQHVDSNPNTETTQFKLYSANEVDGIRGLYSSEQQDFYFETSRSTREDQAIADSDSERNFDIAIRFRDRSGKSLFLLTEGHDIPEEWADSADALQDENPVDEQVYNLARLAADELVKLNLDSNIQEDMNLLLQQLRTFGRGIQKHELDTTEVANLRLENQITELHRFDAVSKYYVNYTYNLQFIDSYWKPAFIANARAHHTATITYRYVYLNGAWYYGTSFVNCNHGTCPQDSSMTWYTRHQGPVTIYAPVTPQLCSGWYAYPHVCNNDTLLQQRNVKYNQTLDTWSGDCGYTLYYAPF